MGDWIILVVLEGKNGFKCTLLFGKVWWRGLELA